MCVTVAVVSKSGGRGEAFGAAAAAVWSRSDRDKAHSLAAASLDAEDAHHGCGSWWSDADSVEVM